MTIGYLRHCCELKNHSSPSTLIEQNTFYSPHPLTQALAELNNYLFMYSQLFSVDILFDSTKTKHRATHLKFLKITNIKNVFLVI